MLHNEKPALMSCPSEAPVSESLSVSGGAPGEPPSGSLEGAMGRLLKASTSATLEHLNKLAGFCEFIERLQTTCRLLGWAATPGRLKARKLLTEPCDRFPS